MKDCIICAMCRDIRNAYFKPKSMQEPHEHWTTALALCSIYVAGDLGKRLVLCDLHDDFLLKARAYPMGEVIANV